jgi:hypothetical protein
MVFLPTGHNKKTAFLKRHRPPSNLFFFFEKNKRFLSFFCEKNVPFVYRKFLKRNKVSSVTKKKA